MLSLPPSVRVFLAVEPVDMRKSFDALAALVEPLFQQDPLSGHLFVFVGRRRHLARILFWDRSGYVLVSKRLERGTFRITNHDVPSATPSLEVQAVDLMLLLEGIDLSGARRRPRYQITQS
jgi:transposase